MEPTHSAPPRLYFPYSNVVLVIILLFGLLFLRFAIDIAINGFTLNFLNLFFEYTFMVGVIFMGVLFLHYFFRILLNRDKFNLIIDEDGFHGMNGITFIAWSEIAALWDQTIRYDIRGRVHRLTIKVKSVPKLRKIIQRERGYTAWMLRTFKPSDLPIPAGNIKMKDVQSVMITLQRMFPDQLQRHHIRMYIDV